MLRGRRAMGGGSCRTGTLLVFLLLALLFVQPCPVTSSSSEKQQLQAALPDSNSGGDLDNGIQEVERFLSHKYYVRKLLMETPSTLPTPPVFNPGPGPGSTDMVPPVQN